MSKEFYKDRLGYGLPNDNIRIGVEGYFSNSIHQLKKLALSIDIVKEHYGILRDINSLKAFPYAKEDGPRYKFFYLIEKTPTHPLIPYNKEQLFDHMENRTIFVNKKWGFEHEITRINVERGGNIWVWLDAKGRSTSTTSLKLLRDYTLLDGSPAGIEKEEGNE